MDERKDEWSCQGWSVGCPPLIGSAAKWVLMRALNFLQQRRREEANERRRLVRAPSISSSAQA
jgi:hypothetical protein